MIVRQIKAIQMDGVTQRALTGEAQAWEVSPADERVWLPSAAPMDMPRQAIDAPASSTQPASAPTRIVARRATVFAAALSLSSTAFAVPATIYAQDGFTGLEVVALSLFAALIVPISIWFCSAIAGFAVLQSRSGADELSFRPTVRLPKARTALLMPLYNEDAGATFGRLAQIDRSLGALASGSAFDIFVLSDSTDETAAEAEWAAFQSLRVTSGCRTYYRRRDKNTERKAGNIADWAQNFGAAYDHMIILDADSTMSGETILQLVDAMERKPGIGLIQTTPAIVEGATLFARSQQFGVRLYGRIAAAGLAWWSGSEASYWGHNAIVRVRAFVECCSLPILPGAKPFGGHVMSHDVVEAAMLRRGGWGVHITAALGGSFEEAPPSLQAFMCRDRRWCQGNLQHIGLVGAQGLHVISRLQMVFGCLAYLASPLWLASLLAGLAIQFQTQPKLEEIATLQGWRTIVLPRHDGLALVWMSILTFVLLFGPKLLGAFLVLSRPDERAGFGGGRAVVKSVLTEMAMSAILAPVMMVSHTRMVAEILLGKDSGWRPQARQAERMTWAEAASFHAWELRAGMVFAAALLARPDLAAFFAPIVLPLLFSPVISVLSSREDLGAGVRRVGLLLTPEELNAPVGVIRRRPRRRRFVPITVSFNPRPRGEPGVAAAPELVVVERLRA